MYTHFRTDLHTVLYTQMHKNLKLSVKVHTLNATIWSWISQAVTANSLEEPS